MEYIFGIGHGENIMENREKTEMKLDTLNYAGSQRRN